MPETRYIDEYDNDGNLINHIAYDVSDEQLTAEAELATIESYLAHSPPNITAPQIWATIRYIAKRVGLKAP